LCPDRGRTILEHAASLGFVVPADEEEPEEKDRRQDRKDDQMPHQNGYPLERTSARIFFDHVHDDLLFQPCPNYIVIAGETSIAAKNVSADHSGQKKPVSRPFLKKWNRLKY
jgi:hypothetical protein